MLALLLLLAAALRGCPAAGAPEALRLPEASFDELVAGRPAAAAASRHALSTLGALAVVGVPAEDPTGRAALLGEAAREALGAWAVCLQQGGAAAARSSYLANGAVRRTSVAAGGRWERPESATFGSGCPPAERATLAMRSGVRAAARALAAAVDSASAGVLPAGAQLRSRGSGRADLTLAKAVELGSHLEHIRLYEEDHRRMAAGADGGAVRSEEALSLHTDAGLMLAFVPPARPGGGGAALPELQLPGGEVRELAPPSRDDAVIFLVGEAARLLWRQARADDRAAPALRPAPHALRLRAGFGWRAWYGVMLLPPEDAPIRGVDEDAGGALTFGEMWNAARTAVSRPRQLSAEIPALGCGEGRLLADQAATCPAGMFECWMTCMDVSALQGCQGGLPMPTSVGHLAEFVNLSIQCVDPETGRQWPDETGQMCYTCQPACGYAAAVSDLQPTPAGASNGEDSAFCRTTYGGTGVTMYMDGFKMTSSHPSEACVSFLLPNLVIDRPWKLAVSCVGVVLMSAFVEISPLGRRLLPADRREDVGIIFYVLSLVFAYLAMLFVMTYSVELFSSTIVGLALGHEVAGTFARSKTEDLGGGSPCCRLAAGLDVSAGPEAAAEESEAPAGGELRAAASAGPKAAADGCQPELAPKGSTESLTKVSTGSTAADQEPAPRGSARSTAKVHPAPEPGQAWVDTESLAWIDPPRAPSLAWAGTETEA